MMRKDELIEALRDRDNARHKNAVLWCLAIIGAIAAIAAIAYAVYRYLTPDYLEDFEDEFDEEDEVVATGADLDCDVYKAGHHGSYTSSGNELLNAVTPEICIISCGADNDYGHPHDKALKRIKKHTDKIYRTDICGSIIIESDGKNLDISYENQ